MPSDTGSAPIEPSNRRTSSHRAEVSAASALPRPLRIAAGAAALAVVLAGSLSFANAANRSDSGNDTGAGPGGSAAADAAAGRDELWAQVSRGGGYRTPLELEAGEAVAFTVDVDGESVELTSSSTATLADALIDAGIVVGLDDVVSAEMGEAPQEGAEISIERVGTRLEAEVTAIEFETIEQRTSSLLAGTTQVQTEGVEGSRVTTYQVTYSNGEAVEQNELTSVVASEPVNEVILVGTGVAAPTTTSNDSSGSSSSSDDSGSDSGSDSGGSSEPAPTYSGGDPRSIAQSMLSAYGWGMDQWSCLDSLWQRESGWNPNAANPYSGAYGIPQSLPGSKMASAGSDWRTNPATQIKWGLGYIQGRYGSPCGAWGHSQSHGWY